MTSVEQQNTISLAIHLWKKRVRSNTLFCILESSLSVDCSAEERELEAMADAKQEDRKLNPPNPPFVRLINVYNLT